MILCKVHDKCVSTIKNEELLGTSFVIVEKLDKKGKNSGDYLVVADTIGCGQGETVLVAMGSAARMALSNNKAPVDAAIVAIVDEINK